jgi:hypothetical protein
VTCRYGVPGCETLHDDRDNLADGVLHARGPDVAVPVVASREASADGSRPLVWLDGDGLAQRAQVGRKVVG